MVVSGMSATEEDVLSALVDLGYQRGAAEKALEPLEGRSRKSFDKMFRGVLNRLSKWPEFFQWTRRSRYALIVR
jgi:Holliday junction resolvasome RuvABC DNA-binding subunit